jgi:hypothetical protein
VPVASAEGDPSPYLALRVEFPFLKSKKYLDVEREEEERLTFVDKL